MILYPTKFCVVVGDPTYVPRDYGLVFHAQEADSTILDSISEMLLRDTVIPAWFKTQRSGPVRSYPLVIRDSILNNGMNPISQHAKVGQLVVSQKVLGSRLSLSDLMMRYNLYRAAGPATPLHRMYALLDYYSRCGMIVDTWTTSLVPGPKSEPVRLCAVTHNPLELIQFSVKDEAYVRLSFQQQQEMLLAETLFHDANMPDFDETQVKEARAYSAANIKGELIRVRSRSNRK